MNRQLAGDLLGLLAIIVLAIVAFWLLPVLVP